MLPLGERGGWDGVSDQTYQALLGRCQGMPGVISNRSITWVQEVMLIQPDLGELYQRVLGRRMLRVVPQIRQ